MPSELPRQKSFSFDQHHILQQRDLLVRERSNFLAVDCQSPEQHFILAKCHDERAPRAAQVDDRSTKWIAKPICVLVLLIEVVNEVLACSKAPMGISRSGLVYSATKISSKSIRHVALRRAFKASVVVAGHKS